MSDPKPISKEAIPAALEKALRYRLLNEPLQAESICRDILRVDPDNQEALVTLLLALTDEFDKEYTPTLERVNELIPQLQGDYKREYYSGIVHERWANAQLGRSTSGDVVFEWLNKAMHCYERAEALSEPDDPDAILRWNTCARILQRFPHLKPWSDSMRRDIATEFGDEMPLR